MILVSFVIPSRSLSGAGWGQDRAREYQAASAKFHELSHAAAEAKRRGDSQSASDQLAAAKAEYEALRSKLDNARARPRQIAGILRGIGLVVATVGGIVYFRSTNR
jgi:hypothetical protein